jgi:hypothetical protein
MGMHFGQWGAVVVGAPVVGMVAKFAALLVCQNLAILVLEHFNFEKCCTLVNLNVTPTK